MALGRIALLVDVDAVAPEILRDVARDVRRAHQRRHALAGRLDRHDADADAHLQRVVAPREPECRDRLAQRLGDLRRRSHRAVRSAAPRTRRRRAARARRSSARAPAARRRAAAAASRRRCARTYR